MAVTRIFNSLHPWSLVLAVSFAAARPAAAEPTRNQPAEAASHFDRGYALAQQGNLEAAITEFKRAQALRPHPVVLYNLGQAYAASGRAVEAVQTMRQYLEQSDARLDADRRAQAAAIIDYQEERIGSLVLDVEPAGAELTLDGEPIGKAPLKGPLPLSAGSHGLTVAHAGYSLRSVRVEIAGKTSTELQVRLELTGTAARLTVTCSVPDVTVSGQGFASQRLERGGELLLTTPPAELRFERAGFVPVVRAVPTDPAERIDCGLVELDPGAPLAPLVISAPHAVSVAVNGRPFRQGKLPQGRHLVSLSGPNIAPAERWIEVGGAPRTLSVDVREPDAAMAVERSSRRKLQLTLAVVTAAAGVVSLGAAGAIYTVNQSAFSEWRDDGRQLASRMASTPDQVSAGDWNQLFERENTLRNRDAAALGLTVAGGLLLGSGAALWLTAPRPATSAVTLRIGKAPWIGYSAPF